MKLMRIAFVLIVLAIVGLFFVWKKMPGMIASDLAKKMQVEVKIDALNLSMASLGIDKIFIGNPKGYQLPKAFSCDSITADGSLFNYLKDPIVIDEIEINKVYIGLEFSPIQGALSNWSHILSNMPSAPTEEKEAAKEKKKGTPVLIKKLVITDITPELVLVTGSRQQLAPISRLEFTNISSESGIPIDQIAKIVLEKLYGKNQVQNLFQDALQSPGSTWDKLTEPLKGLWPSSPPAP